MTNQMVVFGALIGASLLLSAWLWWQIFTLGKRVTNALGGGANSIEQTLTEHFDRVKKVQAELGQLTRSYQDLTTIAELSSQKIAVVRFNPFGDTGGDQSFALAVLDAHSSGYILTSIHGRGGTRVYVKPIDYGKSKYPLSAEEKQALALAHKRTPKLSKETTNGSKH